LSWHNSIFGYNQEQWRLKIFKMLSTASLSSKFTGYKIKSVITITSYVKLHLP